MSAESQLAPPYVAVVQWTHTLAMKNAMLLARAQLGRRIGFGHHIVLQSCGHNAPGCEALLAGLRPLRENVTCFTAEDMHRLVPATHRIGMVARGPHGGAAVQDVGSHRWCWYSCDAAYISWFVSGKPIWYTHFWFLEWDVTWTGDLAVALGAWNGASRSNRRTLWHTTNSTLRSMPDLLCANPSKAYRHWPHLHSRNISYLHYDNTFMCVTGLQRMSMRLISKLAAFASHREAPMFCEMRAPSVCKLESSWCTMDTFFDTAHERYLFTDQKRWIGTYTARVSRAQMEDRIDHDVLWHGYKWGAINRSNGTTLYDAQLAQLQNVSRDARLAQAS